MDCPKWKSSNHVKNGIISKKQRYKIKECGYNYCVEKKSDIKSDDIKRLALSM